MGGCARRRAAAGSSLCSASGGLSPKNTRSSSLEPAAARVPASLQRLFDDPHDGEVYRIAQERFEADLRAHAVTPERCAREVCAGVPEAAFT